MATLKDIARSLAIAHNVKEQDADRFVMAIVDTILDGLMLDRVVKIKGFGTFKLTAVRDRESVNVNTGERVVISGHDKISFTPENAVRDLINKPFAQFETVVLSDSLDFEDLPPVEMPQEEEPTQLVVEEPAQLVVEESAPIVVEESIVEESAQEETEKPTPVEEELAPVEEESAPVEEEPAQEDVEEPVRAEVEEPSHVIEEPQEEDVEDGITLKWWHLLICLLIAVLAFVGGYFAKDLFVGITGGDDMKEVMVKEKKESAPVTVSGDSITIHVAKSQDNTIEAKIHAQNDQKTAEVKKDSAASNVKKSTETDTQTKPDAKYDDDPRVRTGAYIIIGIDKTVTVKEGQTLKSISKSHLGPDMECYVEALNGVKSVKPGDKLNIPKLQLKKRIRK